MGNKKTEKNCLDIVKKCSAIGDFAKSVKQLLITEPDPKGERPDFLFDGDSVGVEHFLTDVIFGVKHKEAQSIERKNSSNITKKINYYHENPNKLEADIDNGIAPKFLEDIINSEINGVSEFVYTKYIKNFKKCYDEHYANRSVYRSKCKKLGFLIELPYPQEQSFIVSSHGTIRKQRILTLPITTDMLEHIRKNSDLDFVILCLRPIHSSGKMNECKAIYINPKDVDSSVKVQGIDIYDTFDYLVKFPNKDVVQLKVE